MTTTPDCPIGWQPNALLPVFWVMRTLGTTDGAPRLALPVAPPGARPSTVSQYRPGE